MKDKKKIILPSIILGVLVLVLGITYASFTYERTGENSKLVLGDIYMHYKETTTNINIKDMMPTNISDYTTYKVNPIMKEQEIVENELSRCITIYEQNGISQALDEGSTVESFCQGTGTVMGGLTIQEDLDDLSKDKYFLENGGQELLDAGVISRKIENLPYFEFTIS